MFDKLVESTRQQKKGRSKFFVVTSMIYGCSLFVCAVLSILWFNPAQAEANNLRLIMEPPVPTAPPPTAPKPVAATNEADIGFIPPVKPPKEIPRAADVTPRVVNRNSHNVVVGSPTSGSENNNVGIPGSAQDGNIEAPPPPPAPPKPTPKPEPVATPTPKAPEIIHVTSTVITGKALRKVQPPYPQIAKAVRAQGTVAVHILISEEGRVLEASVVDGNPTLRDAARQAALQWVFSPTVVSGKAMKVSGVISFNFILN